MKSLDYINNARSFKGWITTVRIALQKCKTVEEWNQIVAACYDKHHWFVDGPLQIRYGLAPSRYGDTLGIIKSLTRDWYFQNVELFPKPLHFYREDGDGGRTLCVNPMMGFSCY